MSRFTPPTVAPERPGWPSLGAAWRRLTLGALALTLASALTGCGAGSIEARLAEAHALQDATQFRDSVEPLRDILAETPDHPEANLLLGVALVQTGQQSLAIWPLEKASKDPHYAVSAGMLLASTALSLKGYDDGLRALDRVLEADPDRIAAVRLRAQTNLAAGRAKDALADSTRLLELAPNNYSALLMHATVLSENGDMKGSEKVHRRLREAADKSGDPSMSAKACLAVANFTSQKLADDDKALSQYRACAEEFPADPLMLQLTTSFLDERGLQSEATELRRKAADLAPENPRLLLDYAARLESRGQEEEAEKILKEATETFATGEAWLKLAELYRKQARYQESADAIAEAARASGGGNEELRFMQADVLIDLEQFDRAKEIAAGFSQQIYRDLILGRIQLLEGNVAGAVASLDAAVRLWPNNPGARYLLGVAAQELGKTDLALGHLRDAYRIDASATEAGLVLANLHYGRGEYDLAGTFAHGYLDARDPKSVDAYILAARAATQLKRYDAAREALRRLEVVAGPGPALTAELASLARAESGPRAAIEIVKKSGLDLSKAENEAALRALIQDLSDAGQRDAALAEVDKVLASGGSDRASLHEIRGTVLAVDNRLDKATKAFQKALALESDNPRATAGLATLAARQGDVPRAIELFDAAAKANPREPAYAYSAAQLALGAGKRAEAEKRLRALVEQAPGLAGPRNDLAWLLAEEGRELERALALAREAEKLGSTPAILDTLGWVHFKRGKFSEAVAVFERALAQKPGDPSILYHLGLALKSDGKADRAIQILEQALDAGAFNEAADAQRELAALRAR